MQTPLRRRLLASTILIGASLIATPAFAQESGATSEGDPREKGTIIVTGSLIASPTTTAVAPIQVINDVQIDQSGVSNIQDLLVENPVFGTPGLTRTNSAFLTSGTGAATVNLRNLGSDRTLVLINGRRVVAGLPGSATVDLNVIPQQFLQRIDILTGGASSLYGSDAVAGVVNFIYKESFDGIEANAQYNVTERGDAREYQANLIAGSNFGEDRGNIMVHFGYNWQGGLLSRQRSNTYTDDSDLFALTEDPADFGVSSQPFFSGFAPQGRFNSGGCNFTYGPTGQLERGFSANGGTIGNAAADACGVARGTALPARGFNRQYFRTISVPVERYLFAARATYDVTDNVRFVGEATYNNTSSSREIEPFPLDSANIISGGLIPIESRVPVVGSPGSFTIVRNPLVPDAIFNAAVDGDGDGLKDISFARRISEFGTRNGSTNRDFYRVVLGLDGRVFGDKFRWDLSYNYGRMSESQISNGQVNVLNFRQALAAIPGPSGPICADPVARSQNCVPINVFGAGSISKAAVNYIAADQNYQTSITQQVVQANLSGTLIDLPAGPLGIAIGTEYRKESSSENNDALTNAGLNGGNALPDTSGSFNVKEFYGEVNVPLLAEKPFFYQLTLRAAGRLSDYSTVGNVSTYSVGGDWAPIPDIRFSGTYSRSVRAPNIGELFTGPSQTFPTGLTDPCTGVTATSTGAISVNCRAAPGVLANIAANGNFALTQPDRQGISGFNSGNPNLNEETSKSYTASVTINPQSINALKNLVLRVDYFNIKINNSIVSPPRQFILDQCYRQGNPTFCQFVVRRPTATGNNSAGSIEFINVGSVNGGAVGTEGIDVSLSNKFDLSGLGIGGSLNVRAAYSHLLEGYVVPLPGAARDPYAGELGAARDRFTATVAYASDRFSINFTGVYIGRSSLDDQFLSGYDLAPGAIKVPAEFYLDTQASFRVDRHFEFYAGVDNLLGNEAPNILSNVTGNVTGTDTAADVYDVFGRRFYAGVRFRY